MSINIYQERTNVRNSLVEYFGDMIMTKVRNISPDINTSYSLYYARVGCLLCIDDRYIIVIIKDNMLPIGHQSYLSALEWISFQTRTIDKPIPGLKTQTTRSKMNNIVASKIKLIDKKSDRYVYFTEDEPIKIELLFTKQDESYAEFGTIQSALDTYNCVISFLL